MRKNCVRTPFVLAAQCQSCTQGFDKLERAIIRFQRPVRTPEKAHFMFASPAYAQAAAGAGGTTASLLAFVPYIAIFAIFYFLMIRPQQQRAKAPRAMIDAVKKGDNVVTGGGIIGKVTRVDDNGEIEVEVAPGMKLRVLKGTLSDVRDRAAPVAANDGKS